MKIIISPFSQKLRNGKENPKNYPWWPELIKLIEPGNEIIQVGVSGETQLVDNFVKDLKLSELEKFVEDMDLFFSVDNFFPHMAHTLGKQGVVLFGRSDPSIFGYKTNLNLFGHPKHFRPDQFGLWESCERLEDAFMRPEMVLEALNNV